MALFLIYGGFCRWRDKGYEKIGNDRIYIKTFFCHRMFGASQVHEPNLSKCMALVSCHRMCGALIDYHVFSGAGLATAD